MACGRDGPEGLLDFSRGNGAVPVVRHWVQRGADFEQISAEESLGGYADCSAGTELVACKVLADQCKAY